MVGSSEVEAVFRRLMNSLAVGDVPAVYNLIAREAHVRMILTGENEWWEGHDEVAGMLLVRFREASPDIRSLRSTLTRSLEIIER